MCMPFHFILFFPLSFYELILQFGFLEPESTCEIISLLTLSEPTPPQSNTVTWTFSEPPPPPAEPDNAFQPEYQPDQEEYPPPEN